MGVSTYHQLTLLCARVSIAYLHEAEVVEELPNIVDDLGSSNKDIPGLVVHDQIQISLPVSSLEIDKTFSSW